MKNNCKCRPFYYDCECDGVGAGSGSDVLAMLRTAMKDEKEDMQFYRYMIEKSQCEADKELFRQIRCDERRHYRLLQEIYRDLTCECYCVDKVCVKKPQGFCRALKQAIGNEMDGVAALERIADALCDIQHREIVCMIINEERCHAQRMAALYQFAQECACRAQQNACKPQKPTHTGRWVCNCEYECDPCRPCEPCCEKPQHSCGCCVQDDCCDYEEDEECCECEQECCCVNTCKDDDYYYYFCC